MIRLARLCTPTIVVGLVMVCGILQKPTRFTSGQRRVARARLSRKGHYL
jgi:hypothetical protein